MDLRLSPRWWRSPGRRLAKSSGGQGAQGVVTGTREHRIIPGLCGASAGCLLLPDRSLTGCPLGPARSEAACSPCVCNGVLKKRARITSQQSIVAQTLSPMSLTLAETEFCIIRGAANRGCSRLLAGSFGPRALVDGPKSRLERRLQPGLAAPQQMQNTSREAK